MADLEVYGDVFTTNESSDSVNCKLILYIKVDFDTKTFLPGLNNISLCTELLFSIDDSKEHLST